MKAYFLFYAVFILLSNFAIASEPKLICQLAETIDGPNFIINEDITMTVTTGGWGNSVRLKDSPVNFKEGKISNQEIISFDGEAAQVTFVDKEVVRLSEISGKYILLLNKKPNNVQDGVTYFSGTMIKGSSKQNLTDEKEQGFEEISCYGKEDASVFK